MSGKLDRLIARVVEGRHEIRVRAPTIFESELAESEEWAGEISREIPAVPLGTISPGPPRAAARKAPEEADRARPDRRADVIQTSATDESRPPAQRKGPHGVEPSESDATPAERRRPARRPPPRTPVDETESGLTVQEERVAIPMRRAAALPSPARAPLGRGAQAIVATRRVPDRAPPAESRPAEPNRITIEIGRINVGGPPPARERMLSLDAYRAGRRDGTR